MEGSESGRLAGWIMRAARGVEDGMVTPRGDFKGGADYRNTRVMWRSKRFSVTLRATLSSQSRTICR